MIPIPINSQNMSQLSNLTPWGETSRFGHVGFLVCSKQYTKKFLIDTIPTKHATMALKLEESKDWLLVVLTVLFICIMFYQGETIDHSVLKSLPMSP